MRTQAAGSFPFVFLCAVDFPQPLWYGVVRKGRDRHDKAAAV